MYDDIRRESSGAYPAGGELGGTIREVKHRGGDAYNATFVLRAIVIEVYLLRGWLKGMDREADRPNQQGLEAYRVGRKANSVQEESNV